MNAVRLMDRTDSKFVLPIGRLSVLLAGTSTDYRVLEIAGKRLMTYKTLYYDTPDLQLYHRHHAGHLNRH